MNKSFLIIKLCFIACCLLVACNTHKESKYHSVDERIEKESEHYKGVSLSSAPYIEELDLMEVTENGKTFLIPKRKEHLTMYACSECHSKPLAELRNDNVKLPRSHWDISIDHGNAHTMNCVTCHNGNQMDELHSLTGETIDYNKSYQLCAQCHTTQFKDWAGGAHGKNISGWAPPRAINTCVNCHNPHKPKFKKRWPAIFNAHKEMQRK